MKWYLVALLTGSLTGGEHANGHSMHAWEMGSDGPGRIVCAVHVQAFTKQRFPVLKDSLPGEFNLPLRLQHMTELELIKTVVCLDEETVKYMAKNQIGRDTLEIRPFEELQRALPKLLTPPALTHSFPHMSVPAPMPQLGGAEGEGGPREPTKTTPLVTIPFKLP
jgi:hypothetical protein